MRSAEQVKIARPVPHWLPATVISSTQLTQSSRSLGLDVPGWPGNIPGQHVDVRLTAPDGYQAVRSYSIATSGTREQFELAVDRLPKGEVSPYLVDVAEVGDRVEIFGPLGGFFVWQPGESRPVQLIAGGSGVVPFVSMIRARSAARAMVPFQLLYSVRSPESALYRDYLTDLSHGVEVDWIFTRKAPIGSERKAGRLTAEDLDTRIIAAEHEPLIFLCGSTGFVEDIAQKLIERGYSRSLMKIERYGGSHGRSS